MRSLTRTADGQVVAGRMTELRPSAAVRASRESVRGTAPDKVWARDASIVVGSGAGLYAVLAAQPVEVAARISDEHGVLETTTLVLLVVAALLCALAARRAIWRSGYLAAVVIAVAAMREMDFHKEFTSRSITRGVGVGFLTSPTVPMAEKVIVTLLGIALVTVIIALLAREWARLRQGVRARSRPVMLVLVGLLLLCAAMVLDDTHASVKQFGAEHAARWQLLEELLEMQAAALFVLILLPVLPVRPPSLPQ